MRFHALGDWREGEVQVAWMDSTHQLPPAASKQVDQAWLSAKRHPGERLFDGPMCRMERWESSADKLTVFLSRTSYKQFLGTNLQHAHWADELGSAALANPVGVSCALLSSDGRLVMGRRNGSVAYYPNRIHPFAGALEPRKNLNIFDEARRELHEELRLTSGELSLLRCTGIAEDESIRQPELIFRVESNLTQAQITARLDDAEHDGIWSVSAERQAVAAILAQPPTDFTPIATAAILCWGRIAFGQEWFNAWRPRLCLKAPRAAFSDRA